VWFYRLKEIDGYTGKNKPVSGEESHPLNEGVFGNQRLADVQSSCLLEGNTQPVDQVVVDRLNAEEFAACIEKSLADLGQEECWLGLDQFDNHVAFISCETGMWSSGLIQIWISYDTPGLLKEISPSFEGLTRDTVAKRIANKLLTEALDRHPYG